MTDRSSGWLRIGGPFPAEHVYELAEMIESDGAQLGWGEETIIDALTLLNEISAVGGDVVALYGGTIPGGEYSDLTDKLTEWGVPFVACWDGCNGAYADGRKGLQPGANLVIYAGGGDDDGGPMTTLPVLKEAIRQGTIPRLVEELEFLTGDNLPPFVIAGPLGRAALAVSQTEDA